MIKLIAVDMDGTLLQSNNQIGEETKQALKRADEAGIKVVPASGRPLPGVIPYMGELAISGDDNYAVLYNGGLVQSISGNVLISHQFDYDEFRKFIQLQKQNPGVNLHFMKEHDYWTLDRRLSTKMAKMSAVSGAPFVVKDFDEVPADFQFIKAEYTGPKNKLDRLEQNIPEWLKDYNVARSDPMILEINKREASKGRGVHQFQATRKLSRTVARRQLLAVAETRRRGRLAAARSHARRRRRRRTEKLALAHPTRARLD